MDQKSGKPLIIYDMCELMAVDYTLNPQQQKKILRKCFFL